MGGDGGVRIRQAGVPSTSIVSSKCSSQCVCVYVRTTTSTFSCREVAETTCASVSAKSSTSISGFKLPSAKTFQVEMKQKV